MTSDDRFLSFPDGFRWGAATSSFQIEGASELDGKGPSIWDAFCREEGRIKDGSNGDVACDHVRLYREDVALIAALGLDTYRFSISWPRVFPTGTGAVNAAGLDFYDRLVDELLGAGITPMPTLYHWDLPQALDETGGWLSRETSYAFADYGEAVVERLGDRVHTWTTLNEPYVSAILGYVTGDHAPGHTSWVEGLTAAHHLMLAHGLAGERIRSIAPEADLAIVINFTPVEAASDSADDLAQAQRVHDVDNAWFVGALSGRGYPAETADHYGWDQAVVLDGDLDIIAAPIDLLGINYYFRQIIGADGQAPHPDGTPQNTMGWELHPPSFGRLLRWLNDNYDFERMIITENR